MVDRLSDLPGKVMDQILTSIPTEDAVKTSVLSTRWRNTWKSISGLSFCTEKRSSKVDKVLKLHYGRIRKFHMHSNDHPIQYFDKWILHLLDHPIEDLLIDFGVSATWTFPSSAFLSWKNLTHLKLADCRLALPSGFKCLKTLKLSDVTITPESLHNLISGSSTLETLILEFLEGNIDGGFDVDAPRLKLFIFNLWGWDAQDVVAVRLINCPALEEWVFNSWVEEAQVSEDALDSLRGYNLVNLLAGAPRLRTLTINEVSLDILGSGVMPRKLGTRFEDLRILSIDARFWSTKHVTALYPLLSSAPNLQELTIERPFENNRIGTSNHQQREAEQWDMKFPRLKNILVTGFEGFPEDIRFVELMLSASPNLYDVHLFASKGVYDSRKLELMRRFMRFERPSPNAVIIVT